MQWTGQQLTELLEGSRNGLNYGPPMAGKTYSLITLIEAGYYPLHLHDFDGKCQSLLRVAKEKGLLDKIVVFRYSSPVGDRVKDSEYPGRHGGTFLDFLKVHNAYYDNIDIKTGQWKDPTIAPLAIAYDTLTTFSSIALEFVLASVGHDLGAKNTDARSDYGKQMAKILEAVRSSKALPCITVWNAHEKFDKDELLGKTRCEPLATGQLSSYLAREFNAVLYSQVVGSAASKTGARYEWLTKPQGWITQAGSTESDLPIVIPQDWGLVFGKKE